MERDDTVDAPRRIKSHYGCDPPESEDDRFPVVSRGDRSMTEDKQGGDHEDRYIHWEILEKYESTR